jgi:hypothetical protein
MQEGEKDGAVSSTDAGGAEKEENVDDGGTGPLIQEETEGSDNATINPESRQFEPVFLLVSSNKINNVHTNTSGIYFYVITSFEAIVIYLNLGFWYKYKYTEVALWRPNRSSFVLNT